jgi:deazaflavin-dependent oxidoreductase (nitroreductase family)
MSSFETRAGTYGARSPRLSGAVGRWVQRVMMGVHRRNGWKFQGMNLLFLTTVGSRSGAERVNPVAWFPAGNGSWLIVASAGGAARNPDWFHNIAAHPDRVRVELADQKTAVTAEQLTGPDREAAWAQIIAAQPRYAKYQQKTDRQLPVIRLTPRPS